MGESWADPITGGAGDVGGGGGGRSSIVGMGTGLPEVTPTTRPFNQPFSRLRPSHSRSNSFTRDSSSLLLFSMACSRSFFLARKRAEAAVFLRRLSSVVLRMAAFAGSSTPSEVERPRKVVEGEPGPPLKAEAVTEEGLELEGSDAVLEDRDDFLVRGRLFARCASCASASGGGIVWLSLPTMMGLNLGDDGCGGTRKGSMPKPAKKDDMSKAWDGTIDVVGGGASRWREDGRLSASAISTDCGSLSMPTDELRKSDSDESLLELSMKGGSSEAKERFVHKSSCAVKSGYSEGEVRLLLLAEESSGWGYTRLRP